MIQLETAAEKTRLDKQIQEALAEYKKLLKAVAGQGDDSDEDFYSDSD